MRAAEPVDNSKDDKVVPIDRDPRSHPAAPVYAHRDEEATGAFEIDVDVRGWTSQAIQWGIIFVALGLLIGGAKWWSAHQGEQIARLAAAPPPITTPTQPTEANGAATAAPVAPGGSATPGTAFGNDGAVTASGPSVEAPDGASGTPTDMRSAISPAGTAAGTIDAPTVRAPADVPYPRRIHDVAPQIPDGTTVQRGIAVLTLLIDTAGNVAEVELLRSLDPVLDDAAIAAAWQWKFEPTLRGNQPVVVRSNFTVRFGYDAP